MRKLIQHIFQAGVLLAALPSAWGFSLSGPIGNNGDAWQIIDIGYGYHDSVAPKDYREGYRPVVPVMYYAADGLFSSTYGSAALTNIDAAFAVMNGVMCGQTNTPIFLFNSTNGVTLGTSWLTGGAPVSLNAANTLDNYSADVSEFSLEVLQINHTAETLGLLDLKSMILHNAVLELGLADPASYVWTLHDRLPGANPAGVDQCPLLYKYLVVMRNFDVNPNQNFPYSPYINGALFNFTITEYCGAHPFGIPYNAITVPYAADYLGSYSSVASGGLGYGAATGVAEGAGIFYTGLSRDDVAGLKFLLSSNTINWEDPAPSGGVLLTTNLQEAQQLTTLSLGALLSQSGTTTSPSTLLTNYPGLSFLSIITNIGLQITTTPVVYFTNQSVPPVFSNNVVAALTNGGLYFTNQPGPTIINYDASAPENDVLMSTLDLGTFSDRLTNDPTTLKALYPALSIIKTNFSYDFGGVTNYVFYLTNYTWYGPVFAVKAPVSTNYFFITNWHYTFGNIYTNHYSTSRAVIVQSVWTTNYAWYAPFFSLTNYNLIYTNKVAGDFFLIPTNWCGFQVVATRPLDNPPYLYGSSNTIIYNGITTNGVPTGTNNPAGGSAYGLTQTFYNLYTNYNYILRPGICEPVVVFATNYATNILTTYQYYFGGLVTNNYYTNTTVVIITTNVSPVFGGSPDGLVTNSSIVTNILNVPSGDFFLVPPAWCGYSILSVLQTNTVYTTNVVTANTVPGAGNIGQFYTQITITAYTNVTLLVQPSLCSNAVPQPALRRGLGRVQFIRANYDSLLGQAFVPKTNNYTMVKIENSQEVVEYYQRVSATPEFLFTAEDLTVPDGQNGYPYGKNYTVSQPRFDGTAIRGNWAGPGTITPGVRMVFNKNLLSLYLNGSQSVYNYPTNKFLNQDTQVKVLAFGQFDDSTNYPAVFPDGTASASLLNLMLITVTPATAVDGTNGVPYNGTGITFTATGGQPPYFWASPSQVPGLSFNPATATLSGTPVAAGVFTFTVQLTDSANQVVNRNYSITIH